MAQSRSSRDLPLATIDAIAGVTPREWVTRHRPHMLNAQPIEPSKGHFEIVLDAFEVSGPSSRRSPQSVTGHGSSAGSRRVELSWQINSGFRCEFAEQGPGPVMSG